MTMGKKKGMARASRTKARGDEKFNLEHKSSDKAITTNIIGTEILKLRHARAKALSLLVGICFSFADCSAKANWNAPRNDSKPSLRVNNKVKSANRAGPIKRAKIILKIKLAAFAILAEINKTAAGPRNA